MQILDFLDKRSVRLISTKQQNQLYYFDLDRLGSVVGLRNENNISVSMFAYDAFGEVTANGEEVVNPFLYTGALYDDQAGLYQMGSRFYDPRIGRFITSDTFGGFASQPTTQNRYAYTANNPVNYIDPTGHTFLQPGSEGIEVNLIQRELGVPVTGVFDDATLSAVNDYKNDNGLGNTGVWAGAVGDETFQLLVDKQAWTGDYNDDDSYYEDADSGRRVTHADKEQGISISSAGTVSYIITQV